MDRIEKVPALTNLTENINDIPQTSFVPGDDQVAGPSTSTGSSDRAPQTESQPGTSHTSDGHPPESSVPEPEYPLVSLYRNNREGQNSTSRHALKPPQTDAELPSETVQEEVSQVPTKNQAEPIVSRCPKDMTTRDVPNVRKPGDFRRYSEKRQAGLLPLRANSESSLTKARLAEASKKKDNSDDSDLDEEHVRYVDKCTYYDFTQNDLEKTHISNWYPKFASVTQKTIFLPIPPHVLEYLNAVGCNLPKNTDTSVMNSLPRSNSNESVMSSSYGSTSSGEEEDFPTRRVSSTSGSEDETVTKTSSQKLGPSRIFEKFDDFDKEIETAIKMLGGSVLPKLNWKSPKDAVWIGFNKCMRSYMPGDIYLLLKASSYISDILSEPYKHCLNYDGAALPPTLVLRKWIDISPASEFRCFVVHHFLVGICQRDTSGCYPTIYDERDLIISDIHRFYRESLFLKVGLDNYVFDVVRLGEKDVKLVDLNLFGLVTDSLLFSYRGLQRIYDDNLSDIDSRLADEDEAAERRRQGKKVPEPLPSYDSLPDVSTYGNPLFRFVERPGTIRAHPYLSSGAPHDLRLQLQMPVKNPRTPLIQNPDLEHASGYTGI